SLFAAIFLTRLVFDVAERLGKIKDLKMRQIIGETHFDFMGLRNVAYISAIALGLVGTLAVFDRGSDLLNIDFTGGSSVTMVLRDEDRMSFSEVLDALEQTDLSDKN